MKKIYVLFLLAGIAGIARAQKQIINDQNVSERPVSSFHAISVSGGIDLYISQDDHESLAVSAAEVEYRDKIKTVVENGVLRIWYSDNGKFWNRIRNPKLKAYVSFRNLDKLTASGASDVYVTGTINANDLEMRLSGASDFKKGSINAKSLIVNLNGASDATLSGKVVNLTIDASGASDFKGFDLEADNCSVEASGASDIHVTVNSELNARASGASGIYYKGEGRIRDIKTSGASKISRKS